jgi:hypothetical protein
MNARAFVPFALALLVGACAGGGGQAQARAANAIALASNAALSQAVAKYQTEGLDAVAAASSFPEAQAGAAAVRVRWRPAWEAWEVYRLAFAAWASAIDRDDPGAAAHGVDAMRAGYCGFRAKLPAKLVELAPALQCGP